MKSIKIAVCGAGPGGLAAALALHRAGHIVEIFDQFDRPKPIGSGLILQPTGLAVLDWLGLGMRMRKLGARIDRLFGKARHRVVLDVRYAALGDLHGVAVHRAGLFNVLFDGLAAVGLHVQSNCKVNGLDGKHILFSDGQTRGPYDLIVDALGSRSSLIRYAFGSDHRRPMPFGAIWTSLPWPGEPFDPNALEQRYHRASIMSGVLPIGRHHEDGLPQTAFFWSLKAKDFPAWKAAGLAPWKSAVMELWPETAPLLGSISSIDQLMMASYDHHTLSVPYGRGIVFIGDSAHSTSPQLGQGANMALLDVLALTAALQSKMSLPDALAAYAKARRKHVRLYQALSRIFTPFYQSDSIALPLLRDYLVAATSRLPPVQRLLANIVAGHLGK